MRGAGVVLAVVALCTVTTTDARPDCNACFMKNAGRDKESNSTAASHGQEQIKSETTARERVLRSKRTAWGAGPLAPGEALDQDPLQGVHSIHSRLRDVLMAQNVERMRERAEVDDADTDQWWQDSPAEVGGAAPEDRPEGGDWGDFKQQLIPSYLQQPTGFGHPLRLAA